MTAIMAFKKTKRSDPTVYVLEVYKRYCIGWWFKVIVEGHTVTIARKNALKYLRSLPGEVDVKDWRMKRYYLRAATSGSAARFRKAEMEE